MRAHLAMLAYAAMIAGSFSLGALAAPHLEPAVLNAIRTGAAALLMGAILWLRPGALRRIPPAPWRFLVLGGLMAAYFVLMFMALRITDPVSTSAVFTLIPIMAAVFGFFLLGHRTRGVAWASLIVSAVGALWVIFRADLGRVLAFEIGQGEALFFVGCICQALYAPLVRRFNRGESAFESTVWTLFGCAICLLPFALPDLAATDWSGVGWTVWMAIAYLTICSTALSFLLLQYGSMRLPAAKVFPYSYLIPSFVILIEAMLGHGWAPAIVAVGAAITVMGLVIMMSTRDPIEKRRPEAGSPSGTRS